MATLTIKLWRKQTNSRFTFESTLADVDLSKISCSQNIAIWSEQARLKSGRVVFSFCFSVTLCRFRPVFASKKRTNSQNECEAAFKKKTRPGQEKKSDKSDLIDLLPNKTRRLGHHETRWKTTNGSGRIEKIGKKCNQIETKISRRVADRARLQDKPIQEWSNTKKANDKKRQVEGECRQTESLFQSHDYGSTDCENTGKPNHFSSKKKKIKVKKDGAWFKDNTYRKKLNCKENCLIKFHAHNSRVTTQS